MPGVYGSGSSASPWTSFNGEPCNVRIWKAPPRSDRFTVADAVPVLAIVTVGVVVVPRTCDAVTDGGLIVRRPAFRLKLARVEPSAATVTVLLADLYGALLPLNGCERVRHEKSQY